MWAVVGSGRPGVCWRNSRFKKLWKVAALKIGHIMRTNWALEKLELVSVRRMALVHERSIGWHCTAW